MLTQQRLKQLVHYDPSTGTFTWKVKRIGTYIGAKAGWLDDKGYHIIRLNKRLYKAHRLAFMYMLGRWPDHFTDHKDSNPTNNKWSNLREATDHQNRWNSRTRKNSPTGVTGVTFSKETKKWQAILYTNRKRYHLGYFTTIKAARVARLAKERELFDKFTPRQYITVETQ